MSGRFACVRSVAAEGLVALVLSGELDIETVPVFEAEIERVLADAPVTVVLDLPGLEFLDSTGLRAIQVVYEVEVEPKKPALPKLKIPPSEATSQ